MAETVSCYVCGKSFYGFPGDCCTPCEIIMRAWVAKGFKDLCHYLEKVTKFEQHIAHQESGEDPAPAADE